MELGIAVTDAQLISNSISTTGVINSAARSLLKKINPVGTVLDLYSHGKSAVDQFRAGDYLGGIASVGKAGVDLFFLANKTSPLFLAGQAAWSIYNSLEDADDLGIFNSK